MDKKFHCTFGFNLIWSTPCQHFEFEQVRYLKIIEKSGYQALPWVRYITMAGEYELRLIWAGLSLWHCTMCTTEIYAIFGNIPLLCSSYTFISEKVNIYLQQSTLRNAGCSYVVLVMSALKVSFTVLSPQNGLRCSKNSKRILSR